MRAWLIVGICACSGGGNMCPGPGDAGSAGVTVSIGAVSGTYGNFRWGANNDCPAAGSSVVSVTITGEQTGVAGIYGMGLCLPRPDLIGASPVSLADTSLVRLESLTGQIDGCDVAKEDALPTGTVTFGGFCTELGAAFNVSFAGQVAGTRTCSPTGPSELVTLVLGGTAAVAPRP